MTRVRLWWTARFIALLGLIAVALPAGTQAQADQRCFPETGYCIAGEIRAFWEQNGGLPIFGFPIGPEQEETIEGRPVRAQWFERNRLELHPENAPPYNVLLGRLGAESLERGGRDWQTFPKGDPAAPHYFDATAHAIHPIFWPYWSRFGLEFDGRPGVSFDESLALFGLPLSEATDEVNPTNGQIYLTQHFERARFEYHPENDPPFDILLGLLGSELRGEDDIPPGTICSPDEPPQDTPPFSEPVEQDLPDVGQVFVSTADYQNQLGEPFQINVIGRRVDTVAAYTNNVRMCLTVAEVGLAGAVEPVVEDQFTRAQLLGDPSTENLSIEIELDPVYARRLDRSFSLFFVIDPPLGQNATHHYPAKYRTNGATVRLDVDGSVTANLYRGCAAPATRTVTNGKGTLSRSGPAKFDLTITGNAAVNSYSISGTWSNIQASSVGNVTSC